jgi:hypothetical protein
LINARANQGEEMHQTSLPGFDQSAIGNSSAATDAPPRVASSELLR